MFYLIFFLLFVFSLILSLFLIPLFQRIARKKGILDIPEERKIHQHPTPLLGGVAIFTAFYLTWGLGLIILFLISRYFPQIYAYLPPLSREVSRITPLFLSGILMLLVGLRDDIRPLTPLTKLGGELLPAFLLAFIGWRVTFFLPHPALSYLLTILWIIWVTNTFNLLDNMDGLAAGVAFIASLIFLYITLYTRQWFVSALLSTFAGVLLGFLIFNFPPAKVFLGDAGSLWIGFTLSAFTILTTYYTQELPTSLPVIMPLLILGVPFFDTLSVIFIRLREKRPIFQADKSHFSHRLLQLGFTEKQAVLLIYLLTLGIGINATLLIQVSWGGALVILISTMVIFTIIWILEFMGRRKRNDHRF